MIYLDNAATTLRKPQSVYKAVFSAMKALSSPGRGGYKSAGNAAETAYICRERAARLFNMDKPENVVFTFNATHALNMAIRTVVRPKGRAIVSGFEHNSVMRPLFALGAETVISRSVPFDREGQRAAFLRAISGGADAVIVNHVSNVFGCAAPIEDIAEMCRARGVPLVIDASQSVGVLPIDFSALRADFIAMPGHKGLYGPQGTGLLLCGRMPEPLLYGGTGSSSALMSMPDFLPDAGEAGTHNMPGIAGLSAGIEFLLERGTETVLRHEKRLALILADELSDIGGVTLYCPADGPETGVLSFNINNMQSETAAEFLAERGIAVRAGLHCAPYAHRSAKTEETGTVRASFSVFNTEHDVLALSRAVKLLTFYK